MNIAVHHITLPLVGENTDKKNIKLFLILFLMLRGCPLIKLIIINNRKHINNNNINNNIYLLLVVCPYVK